MQTRHQVFIVRGCSKIPLCTQLLSHLFEFWLVREIVALILLGGSVKGFCIRSTAVPILPNLPEIPTSPWQCTMGLSSPAQPSAKKHQRHTSPACCPRFPQIATPLPYSAGAKRHRGPQKATLLL